MSQDLEELKRVTALLRERALERYRRDLAEEARLQDELAQIDALRLASLAEQERIDARRLIGADGLWRGWLAQRRGAINQEIATCRARQAYSGSAARQAFAQDEAARDVARRDLLARRKRRLSAEEARLQELSLLRWTPDGP